jgi:hypothetical protein
MDPKPENVKPTSDDHKRVFIGFIAAIVAIGVLGAGWFFATWRHGDGKAEALSGLLAFFAALASSAVTIFYVYLTNASLRKAQASIDLQRDQLEQMKSSVDLQQKEWEQKVRVILQFWIVAEGERRWLKLDPQNPNGSGPLHFIRRFRVKVWNYSEQSFLIESIRVQRSDVAMVANQQEIYVQTVVKPHSVVEEDVSPEIMCLLTQTPPDNRRGEILMTKDLDANAKIFLRLIYSDWSQKRAQTEHREFEFLYRSGDAGIVVRQLLHTSGLRPTI